MLTKTDLNQIRAVIREEIEGESRTTSDDLRSEIKIVRIEIQNDIRELSGRVKNLEITTNKIQDLLSA